MGRLAAVLMACAGAWATTVSGPGVVGAAGAPYQIVLQTNPQGSAAPGEPVAIVAYVLPNDAGGGAVPAVAWSLPEGEASVASVGPSGPDMATFRAARPGTYALVATAGTVARRFEIQVYGPPAAVALAPDRPILPADGAATDAVTVTVTDAAGVEDTGFDGSVRLSDALGQLCDHGAPVRSETVAVDEGQATATVCAGSPGATGPDRVTASDLRHYALAGRVPVRAVRYGRATVEDTTPRATQLAVTPVWGGERLQVPARQGSTAPFYLPVTSLTASRVQSVTLAVSVEDQAGDPWAVTGRTVTMRLTGPASFSSARVVRVQTLADPDGAPVTVYSRPGEAGAVNLTASAPGLASASYAMQTYVDTAPHGLRILVSRGLDTSGMPYNLYDVQLVDGKGQPIPDALGDIRVTDDSAALVPPTPDLPATDDPLAAHFGRATPSLLYAPGADASDPSAYRVGPPGNAWPIPLVDGVATFALETGAESPVPATLTIADPSLGLIVHAPYVWAAGQPRQAVLLPVPPPVQAGCPTTLAMAAGCHGRVSSGASITFAAQVVSARGDPVDEAGLPVLFTLTPLAPGRDTARLRLGASLSRWVLTDAQGIAFGDVVATGAASPGYRISVAYDQAVVPGGSAVVNVTAPAHPAG